MNLWTVAAAGAALVCAGCVILAAALCRTASRLDNLDDIAAADLADVIGTRRAVLQPPTERVELSPTEDAVIARYEYDFRRTP